MRNPFPTFAVATDRVSNVAQPEAPALLQRRSALVLPNFGELLRDVIAQFYPQLCLCCGKNHIHIHGILCLECHFSLPQTNHHLHSANAFTERLWGRLPFRAGAALYKYIKGNNTKKLIAQLKYERRPEVGVALGEFYGRLLKQSTHFADVEALVPVPLHPRKRRMRGYNQSEEFAKGLAKSLELPHYPHGLIRNVFTRSQTKKSRFERFDNVTRVFTVGNVKPLIGKHILLVDDVLTTGATLEACGQALLELPETKLSMATIAIAANK